MSSIIKKLAGQTAVYGLSSIVGRFLNYFLTPLYTYRFTTEEFGVVTEFYAYVSFLVILLTYGMETAFFRFVNKSEEPNKVLSTALFSLLGTSLFFVITSLFSAQGIADFLYYPNHSDYVQWFVLILVFDALSAIPLAQLRQENKALKFALVNLGSIVINISINLFFIFYCKDHYDAGNSNSLIDALYNPELGVAYIFIANLFASLFKFVLLLPVYKNLKYGFHAYLLKPMLVYAWPILIATFAGIINETVDRIMLKYLLIDKLGEKGALSQIGIYGACYKVAILINITIQAFRYAAEPFFFKKSDDKDAKKTYSEVFFYFTVFLVIIFIGIMTHLDIVMLFVGPAFREGVKVVPILLLANIFLGMLYNLSIWYKLTDQTHFGAWLGVLGAVITIGLNWVLIPIMGYEGSAYATLICYGTLAFISYLLGQKYYRVDYQLMSLLIVVIPAVLIYLSLPYINQPTGFLSYLIKSSIFILFVVYVYFVVKNKTFQKT